MTEREQIIAAAKEAGLAVFQFTYISLVTPPFEDIVELKSIERFWQIAFEAGRQAEREECAMEAEYYIKHSTVSKNIAEDIRARRTK